MGGYGKGTVLEAQPQPQEPPQQPPPKVDAGIDASPPLSVPPAASMPLRRANVVMVRFTCLVAPQLLHSIGSLAADILRSASNLVWQSLQ